MILIFEYKFFSSSFSSSLSSYRTLISDFFFKVGKKKNAFQFLEVILMSYEVIYSFFLPNVRRRFFSLNRKNKLVYQTRVFLSICNKFSTNTVFCSRFLFFSFLDFTSIFFPARNKVRCKSSKNRKAITTSKRT